jgi:hypothetical protein
MPSWKTGREIWTRVKMMDMGVAATSFMIEPDLGFEVAMETMKAEMTMKSATAASTWRVVS